MSTTFRINRCIIGYSRRQADELIKKNQITINNRIATIGDQVKLGDVVKFKNKPVQWEEYLASQFASQLNLGGKTDKEVKSREYYELSSSTKKRKSLPAPPTSITTGAAAITDVDLDVSNTIESSKSQTIEASPLKNSHFSPYIKSSVHVYLKLWKESDVICTTSLQEKNNIIDKYQFGSKHFANSRLFPVGRLDKDTTGLILLTTDPSFQTTLLNRENQDIPRNLEDIILDEKIHQESYFKSYLEKRYEVILDSKASPEALMAWRSGMLLSFPRRKEVTSLGSVDRTDMYDDGNDDENSELDFSNPNPEEFDRNYITLKTKPTKVRRMFFPDQDLSGKREYSYEFSLMEGKNRQIHRMVNSFNYRILHLHRHYFCGITLTGLEGPGSWKELSSSEMNYLHKFFIQRAPLKGDTNHEPIANKFKSGFNLHTI